MLDRELYWKSGIQTCPHFTQVHDIILCPFAWKGGTELYSHVQRTNFCQGEAD